MNFYFSIIYYLFDLIYVNCVNGCIVLMLQGEVMVVAVHVFAQVNLPLKSLLAHITGKGLVASMLSHVGNEVAALRKRLAAYNTFVRLFA